MSHHRTNCIERPAQDLDVVRTFCQRVFGWMFTPCGPDDRAFNGGALAGGYYRATLSRQQHAARRWWRYADQLEATRDTLLVCGGQVLKAIIDFPGGRRFQLYDPAGNELAV